MVIGIHMVSRSWLIQWKSSVTADVPRSPFALAWSYGVLSVTPLVLIIVGGALGESLSWDTAGSAFVVAYWWAIVVGSAYVASYLLSVWFCIVGFRARLHWIWI